MKRTIKKIIRERQTVKDYSDRKISEKDWEQITDMIHWSPTSHGYEPYRVLTIKKSSPLRKELFTKMWKQGQVIGADKLSIFISLNAKTFLDEKWGYDNSLRKMKGVLNLKGKEAKVKAEEQAKTIIKQSFLKFEKDGDAWAMKQSYIGLMAGLTAATLLGIGSTPMEGFDKTGVERLLRKKKLIKPNERVAVIAAFGYPSSPTAYAHYGSGNRIRRSKKDKFKEV